MSLTPRKNAVGGLYGTIGQQFVARHLRTLLELVGAGIVAVSVWMWDAWHSPGWDKDEK